MRAPRDHGSVLQIPPLNEAGSLWKKNLELSQAEGDSSFVSLKQVRDSGRIEIIQAAIDYTSQHRDVDLSSRDTRQIVMAGHQPTLFHPGVWYKNFVLSELGSRFNAVAINLVVDNDVCNSTSVAVPVQTRNSTELTIISFDSGGSIVPFEERTIIDSDLFSAFGEEAANAVRPLVGQPAIEQLWPKVIDNRHEDLIGLAIARGRHAYEAGLGLSTLELPVSQLATTHSFAQFAEEILTRPDDFVRSYNEVVAEYRNIHKIRSRSHPVPDLKTTDGWLESPFWIWSSSDPLRRSLFAKVDKNVLRISDLNQLEQSVPIGSFVEAYLSIGEKEIRIRPKALMTTMFSRLIASDLFIHGIGGAKYDQLTDAICVRFFNVKLPGYFTTTATMRIQDEVKPIRKFQISSLQNRLRELEFHPEAFIPELNENVETWIQRKQELVKQLPPIGQRLSRHHGITRCNQQLQKFVEAESNAAFEQLQHLKKSIPASQILNSREFSFCLFDHALGSDLIQLSNAGHFRSSE